MLDLLHRNTIHDALHNFVMMDASASNRMTGAGRRPVGTARDANRDRRAVLRDVDAQRAFAIDTMITPRDGRRFDIDVVAQRCQSITDRARQIDPLSDTIHMGRTNRLISAASPSPGHSLIPPASSPTHRLFRSSRDRTVHP
ncbi:MULTISPECIES: hypothetical protein [unclassified Bradyrhizobium]|uniref:hypothetical protein n=1 Tax=unclassified Bradyrhizobium TaxID=2631580 RepID=UPI0012EC76D6|nr:MULTISPECIES: hypothetical protein [unclassified Bradyrhizobium]QIG91718.1 hypothetical protein G6P99_03770 [Bradyrhizobium sp. 6(2017)]